MLVGSVSDHSEVHQSGSSTSWTQTSTVNGTSSTTSGNYSTSSCTPSESHTETGTAPSGPPTPPTYSGPDDADFDTLLTALATAAAGAYTTPATRAEATDAAIASFTALDDDGSGTPSGATYAALSEAPAGGNSSGSGGSGSGQSGGGATYGPALPPGYAQSPVLPSPLGIPGTGRNVLSADGSVRFVPPGIDPEVWRQLQQSPDGNRPVAVSGPHAARPQAAPAATQSVPGWLGTLAGVVGGFIPGVGEAMDLYTALAPDSSLLDRGLAGVSLAVNIVTGGVALNFGSWGRAARAIAEGASHVDEVADAARAARLPARGTGERAAIEAARRRGIEAAKARELADIRAGGNGSGIWTQAELEEIRRTGEFPIDVRWHHDPTVANRPDLAADPNVVRPVRGGVRGHLEAHGGDFRK